MGSALSAHLLAAGCQVTGYDIDPARLAAHAARGGLAATSPAGAADGADVVLTSLPTAAALLDVINGAAGLASGPRPGLVVIETSTLPVAVKRQARAALAEHGAVLLDCPLSGTGGPALTGGGVPSPRGPAPATAPAPPALPAVAPGLPPPRPVRTGSAVHLLPLLPLP